MRCPCKDCELRKVEIANGVVHDCHSNCPKDKAGTGYSAWKAQHERTLRHSYKTSADLYCKAKQQMIKKNCRI